MKLRQFVFLPLFLCCAIFFRMGFLSFGPVHSPAANYNRKISFQRKSPDLSQQHKQAIKETATDPSYQAVFKVAKNKCVLGKSLKLSFPGFFSPCAAFIQSPPLKEHIFAEKKVTGIIARRHLVLSVIRI